MNAFFHPAFRWYFLTNTLSLLGNWILKVSLGWFTWQLTQSTFWTSVVALGVLAPAGVLGPLFAVFAENWDMRRASLLAKGMMLLTTLAILVLEMGGLHNLYTLVVLSLLLGLFSALYHPVRLVFITLVVPKESLASAIGLNSVSWNASRVVGPGLAGLCISLFGLKISFAVCLLLFLPLLVVLVFLPLSARASGSETSDGQQPVGFAERFRQGGRAALESPVIVGCLVMVVVNSFFVRGVLEIQPAIIGQVLGGDSTDLALATIAAGIGALLSSLWIGSGRLSGAGMGSMLMPMLISGLLATMLLGFTGNREIICALFAISGFTTTVVGIGAQSIIQLEVADAFRARVMTWWSSLSFASLTLGGIIIGLLGDLLASIQTALLMVVIPGMAVAAAINSLKQLIAGSAR